MLLSQTVAGALQGKIRAQCQLKKSFKGPRLKGESLEGKLRLNLPTRYLKFYLQKKQRKTIELVTSIPPADAFFGFELTMNSLTCLLPRRPQIWLLTQVPIITFSYFRKGASNKILVEPDEKHY